MTGEEYSHAIDALGMTKVGAARLFGVDNSTTRRWVSDTHAIPRPVSLLLRVMLKARLSPSYVLACDVALEPIDC